jgi:DnaK suppressor protein
MLACWSFLSEETTSTLAEILQRSLKNGNQMTTTELRILTKSLTARQNELEGMIRNRDAATIETSADALDQIQHASERDQAMGTLARESASLRDTRSALRRVASGSFGICLDCEEDISLKRLTAVPWAPRCISCQERSDNEGTSVEHDFEPAFAANA